MGKRLVRVNGPPDGMLQFGYRHLDRRYVTFRHQGQGRLGFTPPSGLKKGSSPLLFGRGVLEELGAKGGNRVVILHPSGLGAGNSQHRAQRDPCEEKIMVRVGPPLAS
jgi:hypothetical protein